jgi:hypothetical protein
LFNRPPSPKRSMSWSLLSAINKRRSEREVSIEALLDELGDRSFGWSILIFSLVNMLPLPWGATLITGIPLLIITGQMALGFEHVRLPRWVTKRQISRASFRKVLLRLKRPVFKPIEKLICERHTWLFTGDRERIIGIIIFCISVALFIPLPLSGWFPAISIFITAFGLIERDGLITMLGLGLGIMSIIVTIAVIISIALGFQAII